MAGRRSMPVFLGLAVGLGFLTVQRNEDYHSKFAIWGDTVAVRPQNARAHNNLGNILKQAGRIEEAIAHYEQALRIKPDYAEAHYDLGIALEQTGKLREAIGHYQQALRIKPDLTAAQTALARLQAGQ